MKQNKVFLILLGCIALGEAICTGLLPLSRGHLFSLLTAKQGAIYGTLFLYGLNYLSIDAFQSFKSYVVLKVALGYRQLRTYLVRDSLSPQVQLPANSPQRIQEDIKLSYLQRITVWTEYSISGLILVQLLYLNRTEPSLIGYALGYAAISVVVAILFNPRLTQAELLVQQEEASYRTGLVNNILDISGLEIANKASLRSKWLQTEYLLFTKLQLCIVAVLPYLVLLPAYLEGTIGLGTVIQHQATFALIVVNAGILIQMYPQLIQGQASEKRVQEI